jgi:hypothetical protein
MFGSAIGAMLAWIICRARYGPVFKGPSSRQIQRQIYRDNDTGQHYRFHPVPHVCPPSVDVTTLDHSDDEDEESF